jgi:hypothetical protein
MGIIAKDLVGLGEDSGEVGAPGICDLTVVCSGMMGATRRCLDENAVCADIVLEPRSFKLGIAEVDRSIADGGEDKEDILQVGYMVLTETRAPLNVSPISLHVFVFWVHISPNLES